MALSETTPALQDVLKNIYLLHERKGEVTNQSLAEALRVKPATITKILRRAARLGYLLYEPYREVDFTPAGRKLALEVIRHHRLIELYLVKKLGFAWDEVHTEAERLEHAISEKLEDKMAEQIREIDVDPHGHPVPTKDGMIHFENAPNLLDYDSNASVIISEVMDSDAEALRYLGSLGVYPGKSVRILSKGPFEGSLKLQVGSNVVEVSQKLAKMIYARSK